MHRFYAPLQWQAPPAIGVIVVWAFLSREIGHLWGSAAALLLLVTVAAVWYTVRRWWWS